MPNLPPLPRQRGFTLIEAIVVMVVTGIIAGTMVLFIRRPVQNYVDAVARADMTDVADLTLRRMTRELRGALPNSVRIQAAGTITLLEFIPTKAGALYLAAEDNANTVTYHPLSFTSQTALDFDVVGPLPTDDKYKIVIGDHFVVYNLGPGYANADAYQGNNRAIVKSIAGTRVTFTNINYAASNPFFDNAVSGSPGHRFHTVTAPVTFRCDTASGRLDRYWNYGFNLNQADPAGLGVKSSALLANGVSACQFGYTQTANIHTALIGLAITLSQTVSGSAESVTLFDQIHLDNTP